MAHSAAKEYYNRIKSKWATEYPSSEEIQEIWSFYRECGYKNPPATLRSMIDPITFSHRRILDYGCDKALMLDFFRNSIEMKVSSYLTDQLNPYSCQFKLSHNTHCIIWVIGGSWRLWSRYQWRCYQSCNSEISSVPFQSLQWVDYRLPWQIFWSCHCHCND